MLRVNWRAWWVGGCCFCGTAAGAVPAQVPADLPADDPQSLVSQLGDADFKVREDATARLEALGAAALPALKQAIAAGNDPEVCSRADSLVRRIERPRVPADWLGGDGFGERGFGGTRVTTSVINGTRRVDVRDPGGQRRIVILERPSGIEVAVTGVEDGQPVTASFRARSADELRDQDPDAYRIYERWANGGAAMRGRRLIVPHAARPEFRLVAPPGAEVGPPADELGALDARVRLQLQEARVGADGQRDVQDLLRQLRQIQGEGQAIEPADWDKQIGKYNALSDALREKMRALKLPDPGDALPPPANARLGVSVVAAADGGLTVARVIADSRGERLGLKEGDAIRTVNGKPVTDTGALRRTVTESKDPLAVEVLRDGNPLTLKEKPRP